MSDETPTARPESGDDAAERPGGGDDAAARPGRRTDGKALLEVDHLKIYFPVKAGLLIDRKVGQVHAVDDVSFALQEGETLGIVGESGCGKTTLIRSIVRLIDASDGTLRFREKDITKAKRGEMEPIRREMQMVFQDPQASLNPRKRVGQILATPLRIRGVAKEKIEAESRMLLDRVGLSREHLNRFPHEFSGGQRQRIGIARALAVNPRLILLDEPVSALDVSVQAQVINLLDELQDEFELSYLFVAHDLSVVRHVSDRIIVMYLGKVMEMAPADELYTKAIHPYTNALLAAIPIPDPNENRARERIVVGGEPPNPINPPTGCRFHTRCPRATDVCQAVEPPLAMYPNGHLAACHHPMSVADAEVASGHPLGSEPPQRRRPAAERRGGAARRVGAWLSLSRCSCCRRPSSASSSPPTPRTCSRSPARSRSSPPRMRQSGVFADMITARYARRVKLPGDIKVIVLYHPLQYPLARALLATRDAELWYARPDRASLAAGDPRRAEELLALDDRAVERAAEIFAVTAGGDPRMENLPLRRRLIELEVISPKPFVPGARIDFHK